MKAEELLMIGDWFRFRYTIDGREKVKTFRISQIENELGKYYVWGNGFGRMCYPDRLEPILITPEILEKNGFELGGVLHNTYSVGDSNYTITIGKYGRGQCNIMNHLFQIGVTMECCGTVHELQHALRLCGIEKEIEL